MCSGKYLAWVLGLLLFWSTGMTAHAALATDCDNNGRTSRDLAGAAAAALAIDEGDATANLDLDGSVGACDDAAETIHTAWAFARAVHPRVCLRDARPATLVGVVVLLI